MEECGWWGGSGEGVEDCRVYLETIEHLPNVYRNYIEHLSNVCPSPIEHLSNIQRVARVWRNGEGVEKWGCCGGRMEDWRV